MTRITITLPDDVAKTLAREAKRVGTSVSALVRDALAQRANAPTKKKRPWIGMAASGKPGIAENIDAALDEAGFGADGIDDDARRR